MRGDQSRGRLVKFSPFLAGVAIAAGLLSLVPAPRSASAAPDNTLGMAIMAARVKSNGTLDAGSGTTGTILKTGTGAYVIAFDRNVEACFHTASLTNIPGQVLTLTASDNSVAVGTQDSSGTFVDAAFSLLVYCPR
jgi:hypothetical protein